MNAQPILTAILGLLGLGFLVANARILLDYLRYLRRRRRALLVWPGARQPYQAVTLALGAALGVLVVTKLFILHQQAFGEGMMFVYYAVLVPLGRQIGRGFYDDGIWGDTSFIPYNEIGGISWREGEHAVTLIVISRLRNLARRVTVPGDKYGAARRVLRDKIATHAIQYAGTGLDLSEHDERDDV